MSNQFDVAILGAGAGGLFAAYILENGVDSMLFGKRVAKNALSGHKTPNFCLIDANTTTGKKLQISGGGRCNFTNEIMDSTHFIGDSKLIDGVFARFGKDDLLRFLRAKNLAFEKIKNQQYFCKHKSNDLLLILNSGIKACRFRLGECLRKVEIAKNGYKITTSKGEIEARVILLATGALSFPALLASDIGFRIAESFGHKIMTPKAALVGFTLQSNESWMKELSGISLRAKAKIGSRELCGDMLFTHRGISGPLILDSSLFWEKGTISFSFLDEPLRFLGKSSGFITSELPLPKRFSKALLAHLGINDQKFSALSVEQKEALRIALSGYIFAPAGNLGYTKAEVTKGGISTCDFDFDTLESRKATRFFAAGEVLDVTGMLGGYNLQWAFSSAFVAASGILERLSE
ncbi:MAG: aminoacetone oxidase family FAD-binding enzyme [Wolinella sp.]